VQKESPFAGTRSFGMCYISNRGQLASIGTTLTIQEFVREDDGRMYVIQKVRWEPRDASAAGYQAPWGAGVLRAMQRHGVCMQQALWQGRQLSVPGSRDGMTLQTAPQWWWWWCTADHCSNALLAWCIWDVAPSSPCPML
jgi:hypothetical protein